MTSMFFLALFYYISSTQQIFQVFNRQENVDELQDVDEDEGI